jgi:hypothetical protein
MQQVCTRITAGMAVFCACGSPLGRVDHVDGDMILLARAAAGKRRWVPLWWVASVENRVYLFVKAEQARDEWQQEAE